VENPKHLELSLLDVRRNFACLIWMGSVFAMGWAEVMLVLQALLVHYSERRRQVSPIDFVKKQRASVFRMSKGKAWPEWH